jgi:hypothetical protein
LVNSASEPYYDEWSDEDQLRRSYQVQSVVDDYERMFVEIIAGNKAAKEAFNKEVREQEAALKATPGYWVRTVAGDFRDAGFLLSGFAIDTVTVPLGGARFRPWAHPMDQWQDVSGGERALATFEFVSLPLAFLPTNAGTRFVSIGSHADDAARMSMAWRSCQSSGVLRSGGGLPATGLQTFDRLVHGTSTFDNWAANLVKRGYVVETRSLAQGEAAFIQGSRVVVDPAQFRYIDLLHESRHIGQISRINGSWGNAAIRAIFERGAYEYELRLGARRGFNAKYMDWAESRISDYWSRSVQQRFSRSSNLQNLWR